MQSKDHYFIPPNQSIDDIPTDIEHLSLCGLMNYEYDGLIFTSNSFHRLKSIAVENRCFKNVREFVLDGLPKLESVEIGDNCFVFTDCSLKGE